MNPFRNGEHCIRAQRATVCPTENVGDPYLLISLTKRERRARKSTGPMGASRISYKDASIAAVTSSSLYAEEQREQHRTQSMLRRGYRFSHRDRALTIRVNVN